FQIHLENEYNLKFYIEFNPCKECKEIIREINESMPTDDSSKKLLRHITYNHTEVVQAIIEELPKKADKENFPWFR
ncbi:MAG: hypothetical protein ACREAR_03135, partial [Nitrosotalea sp.]